MYNDMSTIIKVIVYLVIIASHEAKRIHTYVHTHIQSYRMKYCHVDIKMD